MVEVWMMWVSFFLCFLVGGSVDAGAGFAVLLLVEVEMVAIVAAQVKFETLERAVGDRRACWEIGAECKCRLSRCVGAFVLASALELMRRILKWGIPARRSSARLLALPNDCLE